MNIDRKLIYFVIFLFLCGISLFLKSSEITAAKGLKDICFLHHMISPYEWEFNRKKYDEIMDYASESLLRKLEREGLKFDRASLENYFSYFDDFSKKLWKTALNKVLECGSFGGHKETFNENLNKKEKQLSLVYCWTMSDQGSRGFNGIIIGSSNFYTAIIYIAKKVSDSGTDSDINFDDIEAYFPNEISTLGHEMMHAFGELEHADRETNELYECIVYCFEFICFGISDFPDYCKKGKNCKVLPQKCRDEIECKQNPPQGGSGGSSGIPIPYKPDAADDHYSYSDSIRFSDDEMNLNSEDNFPVDTFNDMLCFSYYPDILIYNKYGDSLMENLLNRVMRGNYIDDYIHDYFSNNHKILFIGSGELIGEEKSALIKQALESFVANGLCAIRTATALDFEVNKNTLSCLNRS